MTVGGAYAGLSYTLFAKSQAAIFDGLVSREAGNMGTGPDARRSFGGYGVN